MPTATDSENTRLHTCTRPVAVRLRRMLDASLLERAYGRGAHDRVPVEIIDLDDFERHRERYAYPVDIVEHAEQAAQDVATLARRGGYPFSER